jgi:1-deoxy-D-xylulose-5-phosphate reductoisomerase
VEFQDGAILAQLGSPDMRVPIQYALCYPERPPLPGRLDLRALRRLTFAPPDEGTFGCLRLCREAYALGGTACAALSGANEEAVRRFLNGEIGFLDIERLNEQALRDTPVLDATDLDNIFAADACAREIASR